MYSRFSRVENLAVNLDLVPRWSDPDFFSDGTYSKNPFTEKKDTVSGPLGCGYKDNFVPKFCVDHQINSKLYLWRGLPWNLQVDAVVNSTNENLDELASSPGLHSAAGPELAEECSFLGGCRAGEAKITNAGELPARKVIHTVGPKYNSKYKTAAENSLSHCYRACLELLLENGMSSIAMGCIYSETRNFPRDNAAHIAIRTIRRFLEKHKNKVTAVILCTVSAVDSEIYRRLLPLYFPRSKEEEVNACFKLPTEIGDENGEALIEERKIRIKSFPHILSTFSKSKPVYTSDFNTNETTISQRRHSTKVDAEVLEVDADFIGMSMDPDSRREQEWRRMCSNQSQSSVFSSLHLAPFLPFLNCCGLNSPSLSPPLEEFLHSRYVAKASLTNLSDIAQMKILYRGGVDLEGRQVMVLVGAHFLLRSMDKDRFILHAVKEFESIVHRPFSVLYFHSAACLSNNPDFAFIKRLQQILGQKHRDNIQVIHIVHASLRLRMAVLCLQLFVCPEVWKKVIFHDKLMDLFQYVSRDQLTIPDFVFQHDLEVNA